VDGVSGCPYTAAFVPAANQSFGACALEHGASSSCASGAADRTSDNGGATTLKRLRWNGVVLLAAVVLSLLSS
jgi:hypothetical protein